MSISNIIQIFDRYQHCLPLPIVHSEWRWLWR